MLSLEMLEKVNPTRESQTTLVGGTAPWIFNWLMFVMVRFTLRVWVPCMNCNVRYESLKYWPGSCAYSASVWQGCVGQNVFGDDGLTWRVTPQVSKGRASRTTVRASVRTPWWEAIGWNLLRVIAVTNKSHGLLYRVQVATISKLKLKASLCFST